MDIQGIYVQINKKWTINFVHLKLTHSFSANATLKKKKKATKQLFIRHKSLHISDNATKCYISLGITCWE